MIVSEVERDPFVPSKEILRISQLVDRESSISTPKTKTVKHPRFGGLRSSQTCKEMMNGLFIDVVNKINERGPTKFHEYSLVIDCQQDQ